MLLLEPAQTLLGAVMVQTGKLPTSTSASGFTSVKLEASLSLVSVRFSSMLTQVRVSAWSAVIFMTKYELSTVWSSDAASNASSTELYSIAPEGWSVPCAPPKMAAKKLRAMIRPTTLRWDSDMCYSLFIFI